MKKIFNAGWANVQPHSGAQANTAVFLACLKPGDKILGLDLSMGGHLTHGSPANFSGKNYQAFFYGVDRETGLVDYAQLEKVALQEKPKMIICGASAYSRDWDYIRIRAVADQIGALVLADIAHPAGLIATGLLNDPLDHCHIITSTTHKTLRGPRGGIIMMRNDFDNPYGIKDPKGNIRSMSALLDLAVFPGMQGGPLEHVIAAKAVAFGECLQPEFKTYVEQVRKNAVAMASAFDGMGYKIISGGNFHGQPLAFGFDFLKIAMAELGNISERRTYQLVSGLRELPSFLVEKSGLNSGFMIPQYTAASIVSQNKQYATPSSVDSIESSNGQEDHVSMGANGATKCKKVIDNIQTVLAIELFTASQGLTFGKLKSSPFLESFINSFRKEVAIVLEDRVMFNDIENASNFINTLEIDAHELF